MLNEFRERLLEVSAFSRKLNFKKKQKSHFITETY